MSESSKKIIVADHNPYATLLRTAAMVFFIIAAFLLGDWQSRQQLQSNSVLMADLQTHVRVAEEEARVAKKDSLQLKAALAVQVESERLMQAETKRLQNELYLLKKDLKLYQTIMSAAHGKTGIKIAKMEINPTSVRDRYRYLITLIQEDAKHRQVQGRIEGSVSGRTKDGKASSIELANVVVNPDNLHFKFRYFQVLQGELVLPEGFAADTLQFSLGGKNGGYAQATQSFHWVVKEAIYDVEEQRKKQLS